MARLFYSIALPIAVCALQITASGETLTSDLRAVEKPVTAGKWLRSNPNDTFQTNEVALTTESPLGSSGVFCAVATGHLDIADLPFTRRVFFRVPDANLLRLPADDRTHANLTKQCVLSEIVLQSDFSGPSLNTQLSQIQNDISQTLGPGKPFRTSVHDAYALFGSGMWQHGADWRRNGSRWILAIDPARDRLVSIGLTSAAQQAATESSIPTGLIEIFRQSRALVNSAGLPAPEVQRMKDLLDQAEMRQRSGPATKPPSIEQVAPFLVNWVEQSRRLPPDRRAAALYVADTLLANLPYFSRDHNDNDTASIRTQLSDAGAHFDNDPLGGTYAYAHNWLQEAFRIAPDSPAGQQAFLFLLDNSFNPSCCWSGYGFEDVIKRAPEYLHNHPRLNVRSQILLAIGDAYRDRIAVVYDGSADPFGDTAKYKSLLKQSYREALRWYRDAINASPGSESAKRALTQAWALEAGLIPLDTRFVRLYD